MKPRIAGENAEGNPTVGNFSNRKLVRPESASASISFSETNSMTSWPRARSTSATAMPGKRCPPVPPHAMTAFIVGRFVSSVRLNPRCDPHRHGLPLLVARLEHCLAINAQQQPDSEQASHEIRAAIADKRQRQSLVRDKGSGYADVHRRLPTEQ